MKLLLLLGCVLFLVSCASNKVQEAQISFHTQTATGEMKNMVFAYTYKGQVVNMRKIPSFSFKDIETYQPFVAKNGSFGAIFTLGRTALNRLFHHTVENQGSLMISMINGTVSEPLKIDKPIKDGKLVVWNGLTERDIHSLDYSIARDGDTEEEIKARAREAKAALKKFKPAN